MDAHLDDAFGFKAIASLVLKCQPSNDAVSKQVFDEYGAHLD